jgi:hypothetical protein
MRKGGPRVRKGRAISTSTGRPEGVVRVCEEWQERRYLDMNDFHE